MIYKWKNTRVIVITDTHWWDSDIKNRKNYLKECAECYKFLYETVEKCRKDNPNDKIYIIFLGDIFHMSFKEDSSLYNVWVQQILKLRAICNSIFLVVGNHEKTYSFNNPFWSLVNNIESPKVKKLGMVPLGALGICQILDHLDVGDIRFHFGHHDTAITNIGPGKNMLFSHNVWLDDSLFNSLETLGGEKLKKKYMRHNTINDKSPIKYFCECFFAHMHLLQGHYKIDWENESGDVTNLHYLASLGLTNKAEVRTTKRFREVPEIIINNETGEYKIENHVYNLLDSEDLLDKEIVIKDEKKYQEKKAKKALVANYVLGGGCPIAKVEEQIGTDIRMLEIFNSLQEGGEPEWLTRILL